MAGEKDNASLELPAFRLRARYAEHQRNPARSARFPLGRRAAHHVRLTRPTRSSLPGFSALHSPKECGRLSSKRANGRHTSGEELPLDRVEFRTADDNNARMSPYPQRALDVVTYAVADHQCLRRRDVDKLQRCPEDARVRLHQSRESTMRPLRR